MRNLVLALLLVTAQSSWSEEPVPPPAPEPTAEQILTALHETAKRVEAEVRLLLRAYPATGAAILRDTVGPLKPVPAGYAATFDDLFVVRRELENFRFRVVEEEFDAAKYPYHLTAAARLLADKWAAPESDPRALVSGFATLQKVYWRTLASAYTTIEYAKRQYYYPGAALSLSGEDRARFEKAVQVLDYDLQRLMIALRTLRTDARFAPMEPGKYTPYLWEDTYGSLYHFNEKNFSILNAGPVRELAVYLVPAAYPKMPKEMKVIPLPEVPEFIPPQPEKEQPEPLPVPPLDEGPYIPKQKKNEPAPVPSPPEPGVGPELLPPSKEKA